MMSIDTRRVRGNLTEAFTDLRGGYTIDADLCLTRVTEEDAEPNTNRACYSKVCAWK